MLAREGRKIPEEEIQKMMDEIDIYHDGKITFEAF